MLSNDLLLLRRLLPFIAGTVFAGALGVLAVAGLIDGGDGRTGEPSPVVNRTPAPLRGEPDDHSLALPGVVLVRVASRGGSQGSGSGFLIDDEGHIVTNQQVVGRARRAVVRFADQSITADALGGDASLDITLLKVDPAAVGGRLEPFGLGSSAGVRRGDRVIALRNAPRGEASRARGRVSAIGRMTAPNGFLITGAIETDVPLGPSEAGSPLLNDSGQVVGVNSQILVRGRSGTAIATPIDVVKRAVEALRNGDTVEHAYLGAQLDDAPAAAGVAIVGVLPGGPAVRDGLRQGDLLVTVAGARVNEPADVVAAINAHSPGDKLDLTVVRGGKRRSLTVELGAQPQQADRR